MPRNDYDSEPVVTIGSTHWVFSTGSLPVPSAPAVVAPPKTGASLVRTRAARPVRTRAARPHGARQAAATKAEPTGVSLYLRDVRNAILEIIGMACGPGRGNYSTWKTVKVASFRAWLTILGHGDQGRCSTGRHHCGQCANCRIGEEWD